MQPSFCFSKVKIITISSNLYMDLLTLNRQALDQMNSAKIVGLEIDEKLDFSIHADEVCKKLASRVGVLNKSK